MVFLPPDPKYFPEQIQHPGKYDDDQDQANNDGPETKIRHVTSLQTKVFITASNEEKPHGFFRRQ